MTMFDVQSVLLKFLGTSFMMTLYTESPFWATIECYAAILQVATRQIIEA